MTYTDIDGHDCDGNGRHLPELDPTLMKMRYPAWKSARCEYCSAGFPMSAQVKSHWTGNLNPPACTAPSEAEYIAEQAERIAQLEAALAKEKNRADGHCLSADYLREKCGQLEALASSHFADLTKAWGKLKETEAELEVSKASEAASERAFRTLHKNFLFWQDQAGIECKRAEDLKTKSVEAREESNVRLSKIELLEGKLLTARQQTAASEKLAADRLEATARLAESCRSLMVEADSALSWIFHRKGSALDDLGPDFKKTIETLISALRKSAENLAQIRAALPKEG